MPPHLHKLLTFAAALLVFPLLLPALAEGDGEHHGSTIKLELPDKLPADDGKYDVEDLDTEIFGLGKKVIKVRFYRVDHLYAKGPGVVHAKLYGKQWDGAYVYFTGDGVEFAQDLVDDSGRGSHFVYCYVLPPGTEIYPGYKSPEPLLVAVGRKTGSRPGEYEW